MRTIDNILAEARAESLRSGYIALDEDINNRDYLSRAARFIDETGADPLAWKWVMISLHAAIYGLAVRRFMGSDYFRVLRSRKGKPIQGVEDLIGFGEALKRCEAAAPGAPGIVLTDNQRESLRYLKTVRNDFSHFIPSCTSHHIESMRRATQDGLEVAGTLAGNDTATLSLIDRCKKSLSTTAHDASEGAKRPQ